MSRNLLLKELGLQTLVSLAIFTALFLALYLVETVCPAVHLLQWDSPAFVIGIPASILGTAYVLTIKNPNNYMGFYPGIVMSVLLSIQFYLNCQYDQVLLYLAVFIPFQAKSLVSWRARLRGAEKEEEAFSPAFLSGKGLCLSLLVAGLLIAIDYALATLSSHSAWGENIAIKIAGGAVVASSILSNYWTIYKKNDAWMYWVLFSISGIVFFSIQPQPNIFLVVLNLVYLFVNASAQIAWLKNTQPEDFGWATPIYKLLNSLRQPFRGHLD